MILVIGATGNIGHELIRLLSERGVRVRALSRRPRESTVGVEWLTADLARRDELAHVFGGAESLFLLTGNDENMVRLEKNAIHAARAVGVKRIVKLSAVGATDHSRSIIGLWHYNVERVLRESDTGWTILRPHHFMQNLLDPNVFDRHAGRLYSAAGDGRIPFIDTRDIAAAASVVLTQDGHDGAVHTLTGPEAVSYRDVAAILREVLERPIEFVAESDDDAWQRLRAAGQPPWRISALLALASYQRAGGATALITDTVERLTGRPARTVREFVTDHAVLLRT